MDPNEFVSDLEVFMHIAPDMQLSTLRTFFFIAQRGSCHQKDIEIALGISNAAASRNVSYWSKQKAYGKAGIGFVRSEDDPQDRRNKLVTLTDLGREFYNRLRDRTYGNDSAKG